MSNASDLLMKNKVKIAVLVVLLAGVVWAFWPKADPVPVVKTPPPSPAEQKEATVQRERAQEAAKKTPPRGS